MKAVCGAVVALAVMVGAAQCGTSPSSNPFGACPAGQHRIRVVTQSPSKQWSCVK